MAVTVLNEGNFDKEAVKAELPVLIDFWATWCGPCRMVSPIVDALSDELDGKVKVCKVNVDEEPGLAAQFGVMSIPTLLLLRGGKVAATSVGARPKEDILKQLGIA
jgi:thioredoxin 1